MLGKAEQVLDSRLLDHLPGIHHQHMIADLGDNPEIMRDEDHRRAGIPPKVAQKIENLRLNGHVERGCRLIRDDQRGITGERHGDHCALAHAAGEFVRVLVGPRYRLGNADAAEHFDRAGMGLLRACAAMPDHSLGDLRADGMRRVERGHRLLKDHREPVAA